MFLLHTLIFTFSLPLLALGLSLMGTKLVLGWLRTHAVLDKPNHRSNHEHPTPRGGGIAVIGVILFCFLLTPAIYADIDRTVVFPGMAQLWTGLLVLALVSWWDDKHGLPALPRLLVQIGVVVLGLTSVPHSFWELPFWLDRLLLAVLWLWFINLFNFMDGIDGIAASQTIALSIGFWAVTLLGPPQDMWLLYSGITAAAAMGFLYYNWHPAKLFLGDVGSIPLGYLLGYMLLVLLPEQLFGVALLLPAYYLLDATSTLLWRLLRGRKIWQAHSEHAYQAAVRGGMRHSRVVLYISTVQLLLVILAIVQLYQWWPGWYAVALGYAASALLVMRFRMQRL